MMGPRCTENVLMQQICSIGQRASERRGEAARPARGSEGRQQDHRFTTSCTDSLQEGKKAKQKQKGGGAAPRSPPQHLSPHPSIHPLPLLLLT